MIPDVAGLPLISAGAVHRGRRGFHGWVIRFLLVMDDNLMSQDLRDFPGMDACFGRSILRILLFLAVKEKPQVHGDKEVLWMAEYLFLPVPINLPLCFSTEKESSAWCGRETRVFPWPFSLAGLSTDSLSHWYQLAYHCQRDSHSIQKGNEPSESPFVPCQGLGHTRSR